LLKIEEKSIGESNIGQILLVVTGVLVGVILIKIGLPNRRKILTFPEENSGISPSAKPFMRPIGSTTVVWWHFFNYTSSFGIFFPIISEKNIPLSKFYPQDAPRVFSVFHSKSLNFMGIGVIQDWVPPYYYIILLVKNI